jgi:hypothetical protein
MKVDVFMSKDKLDDLNTRLQINDNKNPKGKKVHVVEKNSGDTFLRKLIMDSGIFIDGKLKGNQLTGGARTYVTYQINDIEDLLKKINIHILPIIFDCNFPEYIDFLSDITSIFESPNYDNMLNILHKDCGVSKAKKLNSIKSNLIALRDEIYSIKFIEVKVIYHKNNTQFNKRFIGIRKYSNDDVDSLFYCFKQHIPDAPDKTIADRISEFLKQYKIKVRSGTLLQRILRAKK